MFQNIKHISKLLLTTLALVFFLKTNAQQVDVVDNKGTIVSVRNNNVTTSDNIPTAPVENDVWYDTDPDPTIDTVIRIHNGGTTGTLSDWNVLVDPTDNNNWLTSGNTGLDGTTAFLGHTDDEILRIGTNSNPILQIGNRNTLGLSGSTLRHYNTANQRLVHVNGTGTVGAIQFATHPNATYKPIIFSDGDRNFRIKGPAATNDFFEIGSGGKFQEGRLDLMIGGNGIEPITFKTYRITGDTQKELFRVQNSDDTDTGKTRFGININPIRVTYTSTGESFNSPTEPIGHTNYDANVSMANSTFQVAGSVSKSIITTTGNLLLTEDHYTIIINGNHNITLPVANTCEGREYVLKNQTGAAVTIDSFLNLSNTAQTSIPANTSYTIQSNGASWHLISDAALGSDDQNATEVNLLPNIDVDSDGNNETTVQEAIADLANNNIYNRDGTLTGTTGGNRTMTMGANELTFLSNLNTRSTLTLRKESGNNEIGIAFRNPDGSYKSAIAMPPNGTNNRLDFYSGDAATSNALIKTLSLHNNNQIEFSNYDAGNYINNTPDYFLGVDTNGLVVQINSANVLENIYTSDGTLAANRTITTGGNELSIRNTTSTKNTLTFDRSNTSFETGIAFRNNSNFYDAAISMGSGIRGTLDFYSGDAFPDVNSLEKTLSLHDDNQIEFSAYGVGTFEDTTNLTTYVLGVQNDGQILELPIGDVIHKGTEGSIFFADAVDGSPTEDNTNFFWDDTNDYLGLGTNTPDTYIDIVAPSTANDRGALKITSNDPDIVLNDTDGGTNTITFKNNDENRALIGTTAGDDNFFISIIDSSNPLGFDNDAFTIRNDNSYVGIGVDEANSNLQVVGSVSKSIDETTAPGYNLGTLSSYSLIINDNSHTVILPTITATDDYLGREYVIKNPTNAPVNIIGGGSYLDNSGSTIPVTTIPANSVLKLQSDGTNWQQTNNISSGSSGSSNTVTRSTNIAENTPALFSFPVGYTPVENDMFIFEFASGDHSNVYTYDGTVWVQIAPTKASRIFYPPSIAIPADTQITGQSLDVYQLYINEFTNVGPVNHIASPGAPAIPTYNRDELYYYITNYDNFVFANVGISATGILTYDIANIAPNDNTIINVVFVVK